MKIIAHIESGNLASTWKQNSSLFTTHQLFFNIIRVFLPFRGCRESLGLTSATSVLSFAEELKHALA